MNLTELDALICERCAEKIKAGKRPNRADAEWLTLIRPPSPPVSTSEHSRNAKGDIQFTEKVSSVDPYEAHRISIELADHSRRTFPMQDGTVGSPMVSDELGAARGAKAKK